MTENQNISIKITALVEKSISFDRTFSKARGFKGQSPL